MPFTHYSLEAVRDCLERVDIDKNKVGKVACLSYPDIICSEDNLVSLFGKRVLSLPVRPDGQASINWHKANSIHSKVPSTTKLFKMLGYEATYFDITNARGEEIETDLSLPINEEYVGKFDLVFDCISNQVFNVAECMSSAWNMVRVGGWIVHCIPCTLVNQGFWNVSPVTYKDFYDNNGGMVYTHRLVHGVYLRTHDEPFEIIKRIRGLPDDTMNLVVVKKAYSCITSWPIMSKFKQHPKCQSSGESSPL